MKFSASKKGFFDPDIFGPDMPSDCVEVSESDYRSLMAGQALGKIISSDSHGAPVLVEPSAPTQADLIKVYTRKIEEGLLDGLAKAWGYTSGERLAGYAASTHAPFKAEALAFIAYRDSVWVKCYEILADVTSGAVAMPTVPELMSSLPAQPQRPS